MSIQIIRALLQRMEQNGSFNLYGIDHIQNSREDYYTCCDLVLEPSTLLSDYFTRVCHGKLAQQLEHASGVTAYIGEFSASYIERLSLEQEPESSDGEAAAGPPSVHEQAEKLYHAIRHSADGCMAPELSKKMKAFLLAGTCPDGHGGTDTAHFVAVRSPFLAMRHRLFYSDGAYREDNSHCLSLTERFDFILYKKSCYAFSDKAESFFSLERTFKRKCTEAVHYLTESSLVSDAERFQSFASHGRYPRLFLGFRPAFAKRLSEEHAFKASVCDRFKIKLTKTGKIDTSDDDTTSRFIKLICGRGAQDALDQSACEVPSVHPWN